MTVPLPHPDASGSIALDSRTVLTVSIIIPTMNRQVPLERCLRSIASQSRLPEQVVIVDDGELDLAPIREILGPFAIDLVYVRKDVRGLCRSRNEGIRASTGDIVIFLDDDIELDRGYVAGFLDIFENDPARRIGGVTGRIVRVRNGIRLPDDHPQGWEQRLWEFFLVSPRKGGTMLPSGFRKSMLWPNGVVPVQFLMGGNMGLRREVFFRFRFDEDLDRMAGYALGEDVMFSYPVGRAFELRATDASRCTHFFEEGGRPDPLVLTKMRMVHTWKFLREYMDPTLRNYAAFVWAATGLLLMHVFKLVRRPSQENLRRLIGVLSGIMSVFENPWVPKAPNRPGLLSRKAGAE